MKTKSVMAGEYTSPPRTAHNHGDLGNNTGSTGIALENLGIAAQRVDPFLNACRQHRDADNRRAVAQGHILHLVDFARMRTRQRPAKHGEIFRINIDGTPVDRAPAVTTPSPGILRSSMPNSWQSCSTNMSISSKLPDQKQIYALAGRQLAARVLGFNRFSPPPWRATWRRSSSMRLISFKISLPLKPNIYGLRAEKYRFSSRISSAICSRRSIASASAPHSSI